MTRSNMNNIRRINDFGIQMVNEEICYSLFKGKKNCIDLKKIQHCQSILKTYNFSNINYTLPDVKLKLPELLGNSIEDHFKELGEKFSSKYRKLILKLLKGIPEIPNKWVFQSGWTRYRSGSNRKVDFPLEDAIVLDVEVCCQFGPLPTIATAVSNEAWYSWVSADLTADENRTLSKHCVSTDDLIPLESSKKVKGYNLSASLRKEKITIGHNVSFDRSKVKEQYWLEQSGMRFLDTMSLHVCVSGVTSYQKALLKAGFGEEEWSKVSSLNSLSKVHKLYCGTEIAKESRELFISGSLRDIKNNFHDAMVYCAHDVLATFNVLKIVFPMFLERFPHPVTLAGMLELQNAYLPVNKNWKKYILDAEQVFEDLDMEAKCLMTQCASDNCELFHSSNFKHDLWLWDQDWSFKPLKLKKSNIHSYDFQQTGVMPSNSIKGDDIDLVYQKKYFLQNKFFSVLEKKNLLPLRTSHLAGYPEWYKKLCSKPTSNDWVPEPTLVGTGLKIAPKLMKLTWRSLPVHYEKGHGWGYIVPYKTLLKIENETYFPLEEFTKYLYKGRKNLCSCTMNKLNKLCRKKHKNTNLQFCKAEVGNACGFLKLPHKDGPNFNVGNPLAKDFINKFSENALSSDSIEAQKVIDISRMLSYWRNSRERIDSQFVCWLKSKDLPLKEMADHSIGAIIPHVVVCGTLTRRAVEPTWMTASNVSSDRVGSELRAFVQSCPGFVFVGADVDSQELWIASLLGDAFSAGLHGATPFGWMTLNGQKSNDTDMHSVTAKAVGISRNHAKILNYARIYGAGEKFSQRLLKQFNEDLKLSEAALKAEKMMLLTKGRKLFKLKDGELPYIEERTFTAEGAKELSRFHGKEIHDLFEKSQWVGGTESAMFNSLEMIANKSSPETPFLKCKLSRALEPKFDENGKHLPTRINWVVQSGAVDFLHLMLVSMRWFLGPKPRFCLSFHDEVRYLVPEEYKYEVALALHVTNLLTRAFCVSSIGMSDLPLSVAFFTSVEIDTVLRKDSSDDNKTPSNPFGLTKGYRIPLGESLDIYQAIEKANGKIGISNNI